MTTVETSNPAIVVGGIFPGLGTVQSLGSKGVRCWICDPQRAIGTRSRYARYRWIPDPRRDEAGMIDALVDLAARQPAPPVLIPTDDHHAMALARNYDRLASVAIPCVAPADVVALVVDKNRFSDWAVARGYSAPKTAGASEFDLSFDFPVVAKPVTKSFFNVLARDLPEGTEPTDLRFTLIENEAEWDDYRRRNRANLEHVVVQDFVPGNTADMYSIGVYANADSEVTALFAGRKLRGYPAMYGNTKLGQNDRVPETVLDEVARLSRDIGLRGIAEFEYKRNPETGAFRLIEVNPRCWSWIAVTADSPADVPWLAYRDLTGQGAPTAIYNEEPGAIKYVHFLSDITNILVRYRWDHPEWVMPLRQWWRSLEADRLVVAEFNRHDWPVAVWSLLLFAAQTFGFIRQKLIRR